MQQIQIFQRGMEEFKTTMNSRNRGRRRKKIKTLAGPRVIEESETKENDHTICYCDIH